MLNTRDYIINVGTELICSRGFNAFSFKDISKEVGIANASIHYYFATKTDLGLAVVQKHLEDLEKLKEQSSDKDPWVKLNAFFSVYHEARADKRVCIAGTLLTDLPSIDTPIRNELNNLIAAIFAWLTSILEEGKRKKIFHYSSATRTKALMIVTNLMAGLQISRITGYEDFEMIKNTIIKELKG